MKIIVSSDKKRIFNAERLYCYEVAKADEETEKYRYSIYSDGYILSRHAKEARAITELNKLAVTLSTDNDNLLYYMEDTN